MGTVFLKWTAFALTLSSSCQVLTAGKGSLSLLLLQERWSPVGMDRLGMGVCSRTGRDIFTALLWRNKLPMGQAVQPPVRQKTTNGNFQQNSVHVQGNYSSISLIYDIFSCPSSGILSFMKGLWNTTPRNAWNWGRTSSRWRSCLCKYELNMKSRSI